MKKLLVAAALVVAAFAAGWLWWKGGRAGEAPELVLYGNVDIRQVSLAFDGSGRISELLVEEGDRVKAGQTLARLDVRTLELEARQAEAEAEAQRQTLARLRNGSRPEELVQARAQLASAEADSRREKQDFARISRLQKGQVVSPQDVDQAKSEEQAARAKAEELRAALRLAEQGPRFEEVAGAEAQLEAAEARLALLLHQIDLGTLLAPSDAIVRSRLREPGDMANPQQPVLALALAHPKWIRVYVHEPDLGKVRPGAEVRVVTDSHPDQPVSGTVGYISSVAEFTPKPVQTEELRTNLVYEVRIVVQDDGDTLRLGQPATVRLPISAAP